MVAAHSLILAVGLAVAATPNTWVTDGTGFLSPTVHQELEDRLSQHNAGSGLQILLWIGNPQLDGSVEDWSARAFKSWGVGRKGLDDGVILFIFPGARKIRIEVGYGLEGVLTDARAARIIRDEMAPRLQGGDRDGAARAGVSGVLAVVGGVADPAPQGEQRLSLVKIILLGIAGLFFLGLLITHPSMAVFLLYSIASGVGGGRSRGGGFSGGGGRSGGGGATGSW